MNKWLKIALRILAIGFTLSMFTVLIQSYIGSIGVYRFCVLNNVYGEFWYELIAMFIASALTLIFFITDIFRDMNS